MRIRYRDHQSTSEPITDKSLIWHRTKVLMTEFGPDVSGGHTISSQPSGQAQPSLPNKDVEAPCCFRIPCAASHSGRSSESDANSPTKPGLRCPRFARVCVRVGGTDLSGAASLPVSRACRPTDTSANPRGCQERDRHATSLGCCVGNSVISRPVEARRPRPAAIT